MPPGPPVPPGPPGPGAPWEGAGNVYQAPPAPSSPFAAAPGAPEASGPDAPAEAPAGEDEQGFFDSVLGSEGDTGSGAAQPVQDEAEWDHDGHTMAGGRDPNEFARQHPGIPGQEPAPNVTAQPVARLHFSSGDVIDVDRAVLVGRAPEARRFTSTDQPRLVTVPSPNQEISSTHVEVRPGSGADHGSAIVTDMGSTNGTVLTLPGLNPEDLQPGIAVQLIPGSVIDLGDGVTIQVTNP